MSQLDFHEIASLLNQSRTTQIDLTPLRARENKWSLHKGSHKVHTSSYPFKVLYIHAAATNEDLKEAGRQISEDENTHVVFPPSLQQKHASDIRKRFAKATNVWTTKEYLISFLKDELDTYLKKLSNQSPQYYIDPHVQTHGGFNRKTPNPVLSFLRDSDSESRVGSGRLGILLAEPGQGKTYMSRHLVAKIAEVDKGLVPLMVASAQWHAMSVEDQSSLAKTIAHSFKHFGATIGWLDGHEDQFLRATLKANLFRLIFDGFDEYILRNRGTVQPLEVLETLAELAASTGTRIVITSRTSFWHTNLPEAEVRNFVERTGSLVFSILPFDLEHARNYFKHRIEKPKLVDQAALVYTNLRNVSENLAGRGFVLRLIADLIARSGTHSNVQIDRTNPLLWLMRALCEREVVRQSLPFTSEEQIEVLRTFATETATGAIPTTELLELAMGIVKPSLDSDTLATSIEKFKSHPLLEKAKETDRWRFQQEQIWIALLADQLVKWSGNQILAFVVKARLEVGARQDLGSMIVDLIRNKTVDDAAILKIGEITSAMTPLYEQVTGVKETTGEGRRLGAVIALLAVEDFYRMGSSHMERTNLLLRLTGQDAVRGLIFAGTIARYDFRGTIFDRCRFEHVAWANCKFDENTRFKNCKFEGGVPPAHCEGFGSVQLVDCRLDPDAEAIVNGARVKQGKKRYATDDLRADIQSVITKFIIKGSVELKDVDERHLTRGPIGASRYKEEILEVLCAMILEDQQLSGSKKIEYGVRKNAREAVKFYASNNVFTGALQEAFETLQIRLSVS
ncbi:MAG: hypothetical protein JWM21_3400 [Acidobacteria bacterium]|nr:hypothetical protein [Acidobacteriota bacterium]